MRQGFWLVLAFASCAGCGDDSRSPRPGDVPGAGGQEVRDPGAGGASGSGAMDSGSGGSASGGATAGSRYPSGPYGEANPQVGDVVENLRLQGFVNPAGDMLATTRPFVQTSLSEFRDQGARYLLVHTATAWCTSCRAAADDMGDRGQEVLDAGGAVLELLLDGILTNQAPTESEIASWVEAHDLVVTTVGIVDARGREVFPAREYAYILDLETMQVLWREEGLYASPTIADAGIERILGSYLD